MDKVEQYQNIVKNLIRECAAIRPSYGDIEAETIFDDERNHYEMMHVGWNRKRRIHGSVLHIDIRNGKVYIQHDGIEGGVAEELVEAGIPREDIVLAFHPPSVRKYTDYAVA